MHVLPPRPGGIPAPGEFDLPFLSRTEETPTATTFRFSTQDSGFTYRSNQFVRMVLPHANDPRPWRMFSLSSSPSEPDLLAVTVKMTDSPFKRGLKALRPGDRVRVYGPFGDLLYDPARHSVFVAGGIGVTPFRGMIRFAADTGVTKRIILLYSARAPEELAFREELDSIVSRHPQFEVRYTVTRPETSGRRWNGTTGRIDLKALTAAVKELDHPKVYVVGLPEMAKEVLSMLKGPLGFSEADLEYEFFMGY